jgi:ABC-type lipoprotein release transport system permease subunit
VDNAKKDSSTILWIIVILLGAVLLTNVFSIITTFQQNAIARERATSYEERVQKAQALVDRQRDIILDLVDDYESAAYDNPNVDRITEQQLYAAEYQLQALQILAIQNSQLIELISAAP